jgi:anti-sigma factor RsiW
MTELDQTWAQTQIEAMADGTLSPEGEERMRTAMDRDPDLAKRVEQARVLRQLLGRMKNDTPVPRGLWWRLWRIPAQDRARGFGLWMPAGVLATALVAVLGFNLYLGTSEPTLDAAEQAAAIEDFAITLAYLQKGAVMAQNEINETFGSGVASALTASRGMIEQTDFGTSDGERKNVD